MEGANLKTKTKEAANNALGGCNMLNPILKTTNA